MEEYIKIPTHDNHEIKWVLNWEQKSNKLIIFIHGFTGSLHEAHYYAAKQYFTAIWYEVFRFNFYTDWENTRKLKDSSIEMHSRDLETVLAYFWEWNRDIYLVWHSLAWPCIAWITNVPTNVKEIVLWDPALSMKATAIGCYEKDNSLYRQLSGKDVEISKEMYSEFLEDLFLQALENNSFPKKHMSAIYASKSKHVNNKIKTDDMWIKSYIVEGANHGFTQEWKYQALFEKTLEFITK